MHLIFCYSIHVYTHNYQRDLDRIPKAVPQGAILKKTVNMATNGEESVVYFNDQYRLECVDDDIPGVNFILQSTKPIQLVRVNGNENFDLTVQHALGSSWRPISV